jgi:hypothetical protein
LGVLRTHHLTGAQQKCRTVRPQLEMAHRNILALAAALAFLGCDGPQTPVGEAVSRDSAGVTIVVNADVADLPVREVPESPTFRVGWAPDDPPLERISSGLLLPDGRAAFLDGQAALLYLVDSTGTVEPLGRRGEGPGEFEGPASVFPLPDGTLAVWDGSLNRLSRFTGDGEFLDSELISEGGLLSVEPRGVVGGHSLGLVPTSISFLPGQTESRWYGGPLVLRDLETLEPDSIGQVNLVLVEMEDGRPIANPFSYFGSGGVFDGGFVWGTNDRPEIRWIGPDGSPDVIARWTQQRAELDDQVWAQYAEIARSQNASAFRPTPDDAFEETLRTQRSAAPDQLPYFRQIHSTTDGTVWVSEYGLSPQYASRFLVVAADGRTSHWVTFPRPIRLLDVSSERVVGIEVDDYEVQSVVVYPIAQ